MLSNDIYLVDLKFQTFSKEGMYEVMIIKIKQFSAISTLEKYEEILQNSFIPHLKSLRVLEDKDDLFSISEQLLK